MNGSAGSVGSISSVPFHFALPIPHTCKSGIGEKSCKQNAYYQIYLF